MIVTPDMARWVAWQIGLPHGVDLGEFRAGIEVELEHGGVDPRTNVINGDVVKAGRIALAHLMELPDYYTRLRAMEGKVKVGDWGCVGIDTEKWKAENRVPLFPGKMNRWLLARTLRDRPTADDLRQTLNFVFAKWFDGMAIDPLLETSEGGRAGGGIFENMALDNLRELNASQVPFQLSQPAARRETIPYPPVPLVNPEGGVIYIECEFAYRGQNEDMPWPVRTGAPAGFVQLQSRADCPINADWMLVAAGKPLSDAPEERGISDILRERAGDAIMPVLKIGTWPLALVVGGLGLLWFARRQIGL